MCTLMGQLVQVVAAAKEKKLDKVITNAYLFRPTECRHPTTMSPMGRVVCERKSPQVPVERERSSKTRNHVV